MAEQADTVGPSVQEEEAPKLVETPVESIAEVTYVHTVHTVHAYMYIHVHVCEGESWYHKRSVTPISVLKAGHVKHLPQCIYFSNLWISISLSLF